jgi:pimeloyl-ACP methyl ester carboxylesterase
MQVHYEQYGEGSPLIILHGLFGSLDNWRTLIKVFSKAFHVFALDQRNHGHSPHSHIFNYPAMVEDLREFMEAHALAPASVLGHSMGGKVAMLFAVTYPELINKLVVVDIAPKAYGRGHDDVFDALFSLDLTALQRRQDAETRLAAQLPDLALRQFLLKNLERDESGHFHWRIALEELYANYPALLQAVHGEKPFTRPTLFIRGAHSDYIRDSDVPSVKVLFPQAEVITIPNAGHWVHAEQPQEFTRIVLNFLGEES